MYRIYLFEKFSDDTSNWTELDCEGVSFNGQFQISDIADITQRKDNYTKTLIFKGTEVNNRAFGSIYDFNKSVDRDLENKLFFNYSSLRGADCLVYEDGEKIIQGTIRIIQTDKDKSGNISYQATIVGSLIDIKIALGEKTLSDISFSDLGHTYSNVNIVNSWNGVTGSGYVYPLADYGVPLNGTFSADTLDINILNFRPAIYAKEYLNRIFSGLTGYSYEIKGDTDFINDFNSLIIPNNQDILSTSLTQSGTFDYSQQFSLASVVIPYPTVSETLQYIERRVALERAIPFNAVFNPLYLNYSHYTYNTEAKNIMVVNKAFKADCRVTAFIPTYITVVPSGYKGYIQLVERDYVSSGSGDLPPDMKSWSVIGQYQFGLTGTSGGGGAYLNSNISVDFVIPEREYKRDKQLMLRLYVTNPDLGTYGATNSHAPYGPLLLDDAFVVGNASVSFPKDGDTGISFEIAPGDYIKPVGLSNLKQIDFIKSLIGLFNLYVYTDKSKSTSTRKHLVFEPYDSFYQLAHPYTLSQYSLNWTNKVDHSQGYKMKSNVTIPSSYQFTYKSDNDFLNKNYKDTYSNVYGEYEFVDSLGTSQQKKLEVSFSPSPMLSSYNRLYPVLYSVDSNGFKQPMKTNPRILFWNGKKDCLNYNILSFTYSDSIGLTGSTFSISQYGQASNFSYKNGYYDDLNFAQPSQYYYSGFTFSNSITLYDKYYAAQTEELINPNIFNLEVQMNLNQNDIANLDFRVPVYIDFGDNGHSYFKVQKVEYSDNKSTSLVYLQKIVSSIYTVTPPPIDIIPTTTSTTTTTTTSAPSYHYYEAQKYSCGCSDLSETGQIRTDSSITLTGGDWILSTNNYKWLIVDTGVGTVYDDEYFSGPYATCAEISCA